MAKTFYITTPIYYASGRLHLGSASTTCFCDSLKRYKMQLGYDTFFLTGLDEHGQKVEKKATEKGVTPQEYVDHLALKAKDLWKYLDCNYDYFIRTTDKDHMEQIQEIFERMLKKGDIYLGEYDGWYCVSCEEFFTNSEVGENHICPMCGKPVSLVKEESYFFRLSKYQEKLLDFIEKNPDFIRPEGKKTEVVSFIKSGLQDLSVSRSTFKWGVPIKSDPKHVTYVWLDALFNYLTALGVMKDSRPLYDKYWMGDEVVHVVAKDILRFHAIFWPIFLMSLDIPINFKLICHSWFLMMGEKMSKSRGNVIYPETFVERYGLDSLRYYILREFPFGNDTVCTPMDYIQRYNTDLVNDYGNLVSRSISMGIKYFNGKVRNVHTENEYLLDLERVVKEQTAQYHKDMNGFRVDKALQDINVMVSRTNKVIDETAPWTLFKEGKMEELEAVIYHLLEAIRIETVLYIPYLIESSDKVFNALGVNEEEKALLNIEYFNKQEYNISALEKALFPREGKPEEAKEALIADMAVKLSEEV